MSIYDEVLKRMISTDLFSAFDSVTLKSLLNEENTQFKTYKNGQLIYSAESFIDAIGFIVSGSAKVVKKGGGVLVGRLFENDIFGCQSLFIGKSYFTNEIFANGETTVFFLKKAAVVAMMQSEQNFSLDYIRYLSKRIYFLNQKIIGFTGGSAESRLANFLISAFGDYKTYQLDMPMNQLAVSLDIGRASLYRALDSLIEQGAIEKNGKLIRLINKEALIAFVKG